MNAYMNISVRVLSANAQAQIKALQAQVRALEGQLARANATSASPNGIGGMRQRKSLGAFGNQLQWTGRQLQYNWTLPLLLAGGAAAKFSLDNEKAFTRVTKVYGDSADATAYFKKNQDELQKVMERHPEVTNAAEAASAVFKEELDALGDAMEALSSHYGVQQKEVMETAGAWAAAGASGKALAESTELSIKAAILGDMDLAKATESLIAIQSQYSLSTAQLNLTLAELNAIENQTGISMQGLIDGFSRSAGVAREAGVDVRHLGAMLAALVPATGSAATAGNALKTIISRLMSPTKDAADVMRQFGVDTRDAAWQSSTAMERLEILADHMNGTLVKTGKATKDLSDDGYKLSDSQKQVVASVLGSRYQMNRFLVLMRELGPEQTYYEKALDATANKQKVFAQMTKELNAVLDSSPKRLEIMWYTLQNGLADAIQPMIPYIIYLTSQIAQLAQAFGDLDPSLQKFVLIALLALAAVGPLVRYFGSLMTLIWAMGRPFAVLGGLLGGLGGKFGRVSKDGEVVRRSFLGIAASMLGWPFRTLFVGLGALVGFMLAPKKALVSLGASLAGYVRVLGAWIVKNKAILFRLGGIWGAALAVVIGVIYRFRDQIGTIWNNTLRYFSDSNNAVVRLIIRAWNALPQGVANALTRVATIVRDAALQIYEWFSYINPWAHHSPSLVENVESGMARVTAAFGAIRSPIKAHLKGAYADIKAFGQATRGLIAQSDALDNRRNRRKIAKFAPGALKEYDEMSKKLKQLQKDLARLDKAIDKQQAVVDAWQAKVDAANKALDRQEKKLDRLIAKQQKWQEKLDEATDRLQYFANAPIKGMEEMSDKIFENEMAQKALRLEMMRMEDAVGTFDELQNKMQQLAGAQELLSGQRADLRAAGAGSEILGVYDDQIKSLDQQRDAYTANMQTLADMQKELDRLGRTAEMLDLEQSLKFDPLTRAIEKAVNASKELTFEEIIAGVNQAQIDIAKYTEKLNEATAAVEQQQQVVEQYTEIRDAYQERLDAEQAALDKLKDLYSDVSDAINTIESSMQSAVSAAENLIARLEELKNKKDEAKSKGADEYLSPAVQNFQDAAGGNFANVGGAGIPMRTNWASQADKIKKFAENLSQETAAMFDSINPFASIKKKWGQFKGWMKGAWEEVVTAANDAFSHIFDGVNIGGGTDKITDGFREAWASASDWFSDTLQPKLAAAWRLISKPISRFIDNVWSALKDAFGDVAKELAKFGDEADSLMPALKGLWQVLKLVGAIVGGLLVGAFVTITNILGEVLPVVIRRLGNVFENVIQVFRGAFQVVEGFLMLFNKDTFLEGLKKIGVGILNMISGLFGAIGQIIWGAVQLVLAPIKGIVYSIWDFFNWLWDELVGHSIIPDIVNGIIEWFGKLVDLAQWVWDNVAVPIYDFFVKLWDVVEGALSLWWGAITTVWKVLWGLAQWWWKNILEPIYNKLKALWDSYIKPYLATWLSIIKAAWDTLKNLATWWWEHILQPILKQIKKLWDEKVKPELSKWLDRIKTAWDTLKSIATWFWDEVLDPILTVIKNIWKDEIKPELGKWKDRFENVWSGLKKMGDWIKTEVMDPVHDAFANGWNAVKTWFKDHADMLTKPAKTIVGVVIDAVNLLIKGLNKVAEVLPGFDWDIGEIKFAKGGVLPEYASGTAAMARRVGSGFKTNGARAIVGEGKANHPEFVIPTDPTFRNRAQGLLMQAAAKLGMHAMSVNPQHTAGDTTRDAARMIASGYADYGLPKYGLGGIIGDVVGGVGDLWGGIKDLPGDVVDYLSDHLKDAVSFLLKPFKDQALNLVDKAGWDFARGIGRGFVNSTFDWALAADKGVNKNAEDLVVGTKNAREALAWARTQVGKPYGWGSVGPDAYDCSGFMSALTNVIRGKSPYSRVGSTASFPWGGFAPGAQPQGFTIGSTSSYAGGVGHMAGTLAGVNVESAGGVGVRVGSSARGYNDSGFNEIYHLTNAARGAIVRASRGGSFIRAGEGGHDEAVIPLPYGWRNPSSNSRDGGDGDTTIIIEGDLSFPNITDPDDAEAFIENLKSLAGGGQ